MLDINVGNVITVGVVSILAVALVNAGLKAAGINANWLA